MTIKLKVFRLMPPLKRIFISRNPYLSNRYFKLGLNSVMWLLKKNNASVGLGDGSVSKGSALRG